MPSNLSFLPGAHWRRRTRSNLTARPDFCIQLSNLRLHHFEAFCHLTFDVLKNFEDRIGELWLPSKIRSESFTSSNCLASSTLSVCSNVSFTSLILVKIVLNSDPTVFTRVPDILKTKRRFETVKGIKRTVSAFWWSFVKCVTTTYQTMWLVQIICNNGCYWLV